MQKLHSRFLSQSKYPLLLIYGVYERSQFTTPALAVPSRILVNIMYPIILTILQFKCSSLLSMWSYFFIPVKFTQ